MHTSGDDCELRRKRAQTLHELEMMFRAEGCGDFVYDEEHDLFCFPEDGRFAFSKEWADIELSRNVATMGEITFQYRLGGTSTSQPGYNL